MHRSKSRAFLGVDVGTSSTKGVLVAQDGSILVTATVSHETQRPRPGHVEMDGRIWWDEFVELSQRIMTKADSNFEIAAVGVSGMGPCVLLADERDEPVRPAILYGVDTRATVQIEQMTTELGENDIARVGGSRLTSQAAGPKIRWVAQEEPDAYLRARRLFMPASWLVRRLTGEYVLDHQSASQATPLYDIESKAWHTPWWETYAAGIDPPQLRWAGEVAGAVTDDSSAVTGIPAGTPVITGTIDAWTEAVSVDAHQIGDLMIMYGTTMFLVATENRILRSPSMWSTVGAFPGTYNLAGGLATSGALTAWLKDLTNADYQTLLAEAAASELGARGLVMLPYFSGERTPILDPNARGVIAGLTLSHTRGDLYRAVLEATALAVRHNVETMRAAGITIRRVIAVGGGTQGSLWLQIVSDATGLTQQVPRVTIGASYGAAFLAAVATSPTPPQISEWNPAETMVTPDAAARAQYDALFDRYLRLYDATKDIVHELAEIQLNEGATRPATTTPSPRK